MSCVFYHQSSISSTKIITTHMTIITTHKTLLELIKGSQRNCYYSQLATIHIRKFQILNGVVQNLTIITNNENGADSSMKMSAAAGNGKKSGRGPNNEPAGNEKKTLRGPSNQDHARLFGPFGSNGNGTSMKKTDAAGNGKKSGRGPNNWSGLGNNEAFGSHGDIPSKNNSGAAGNRKKTGSGFNNNEPEPDLAGAVDVVLYYVAKKLAVLLRNFP